MSFAPPLLKLGSSGIGVAAAPTGGMGLALDEKGKVPVGALPAGLFAAVETSETTTSTSYADLATAGPSITIPVTGTYRLSWGATMEGTAQDRHFAALKLGTASTSDNDAVSIAVGNPAGQSQGGSVSRKREYSLTAGDVVKLQYRTALGNTLTAAKRWLEAIQVVA